MLLVKCDLDDVKPSFIGKVYFALLTAMKRDDSLWKAILEDLFDDFLHFFFSNADELFDIERGFEFLDKELETLFPSNQDEFYPKYVDKLVKVYTNQKEEQWMLIHIEVQGSTDKEFSQRTFTYFYRIFDKYQQPITAFALLTDKNKRFQPHKFERKALGTSICYEFNTYKVLAQKEEMLTKSDNPFAMVVLTVLVALQKGKISEGNLFDQKMDLAKRLLSKQFSKDKIRALMNFLKLYVRFEDESKTLKFEQELIIITDRPKSTMGIEEFVLARAERNGEKKGIKKGMLQKEREKNLDFVKNLLQKTEFSNEQIADLAGVQTAFVEQVRKELK